MVQLAPQNTNTMATFQILYGDGSSIAPSGLLLNAEEIAEALSRTNFISKKHAWDLIYLLPRRYSTLNGTNFIWINFESLASLIAWVRDEVAPSGRAAFNKAAKELTDLCDELADYKRMTYQAIAGTLTNAKL